MCACLATLTALAGFARNSRLIIERMSKHSKASEDSPFSQFLEPKLLKKIYGNKDIAVQKSFYRFLASIANNLPGLILLVNSNEQTSPTSIFQYIISTSQKSLKHRYNQHSTTSWILSLRHRQVDPI
jgi:hypothetical protein